MNRSTTRRGQIVRMPGSRIIRRLNARKDLGDPEKAKALAISRLANQIHPCIARTDLTLIDGHRTLWGMELEGRLDEELDFILIDDDLTPQEIAVMQGVSAIHREDWNLADKCEWIDGLLKTMSGKDLAAMAGVDPGTISKLGKYALLTPEGKQAVRDGQIGLRDMVILGGASEAHQSVLLGAKQKGMSTEKLAALSKKLSEEADDKTPPERVSKIKIPLAINTDDVKVKGVATVESLPGETMTLEDAEGVLTQALKAVKDARKQGLGTKAFQAMCRDKAKPVAI